MFVCAYICSVRYILGKGGEKTSNKNQDNINIHTAEPNKNTRKTSGAGENRTEFLDVNWENSLRSLPPCYHSHLYQRILLTLHPLNRNGLKLVCNVNIVPIWYGNLQIRLRNLNKIVRSTQGCRSGTGRTRSESGSNISK